MMTISNRILWHGVSSTQNIVNYVLHLLSLGGMSYSVELCKMISKSRTKHIILILNITFRCLAFNHPSKREWFNPSCRLDPCELILMM